MKNNKSENVNVLGEFVQIEPSARLNEIVEDLSEIAPNILASALVASMKKQGHDLTFTPSRGSDAGNRTFDVTLHVNVFTHNPSEIIVKNSFHDVDVRGEFIK